MYLCAALVTNGIKNDSWKLIRVRLWRLITAPRDIEIPAAVASPLIDPPTPTESIAPVESAPFVVVHLLARR